MPDPDLLADRYRLRERLGRGAMGEVWLAEDQLLGRTVAVKRLLATPGVAADPTHTERVMREARLAGRLSHPNAVAVYDLLVSDGVPVVVMEYVPGTSLGALIRERGRIGPTEAARIGAGVAGALQAAHAAGIVHRDVKPDNVLLTRSGTAKLADFGIARAAEEAAITQTGMTVGTPSFLAPEVARGHVPEPASDLWSLGATLFAAVDGHPPFGGPHDNALAVLTKVVGDPVPVPQYAGPLTAVIDRMLQRDPSLRPTAAGARTVLSEISAGRAGSETTAFPPLPDDRTRRLVPAAPMAAASRPDPTRVAPAVAPVAARPRTPLDERPRRGASRVVLALLVLAAVLAAAVVAVVFFLRDTSQNPTPGPGPSGSVTRSTAPTSSPAPTSSAPSTSPSSSAPTTRPTSPTTTPPTSPTTTSPTSPTTTPPTSPTTTSTASSTGPAQSLGPASGVSPSGASTSGAAVPAVTF